MEKEAKTKNHAKNPRHDAVGLLRDLGGKPGIRFLMQKSRFGRESDVLPSDNTIRMWINKREIPAAQLMRLVLAYYDRYGEHLDLEKYFFRVGESKTTTRPRGKLVYRNGRRVKREDLVSPMSGVMR